MRRLQARLQAASQLYGKLEGGEELLLSKCLFGAFIPLIILFKLHELIRSFPAVCRVPIIHSRRNEAFVCLMAMFSSSPFLAAKFCTDSCYDPIHYLNHITAGMFVFVFIQFLLLHTN